MYNMSEFSCFKKVVVSYFSIILNIFGTISIVKIMMIIKTINISTKVKAFSFFMPMKFYQYLHRIVILSHSDMFFVLPRYNYLSQVLIMMMVIFLYLIDRLAPEPALYLPKLRIHDYVHLHFSLIN